MCCDGRVVKASDSKSDGVTRTGSNPVRSEFFFSTLIYNNFNSLKKLKGNIQKLRGDIYQVYLRC